MKISPSETEITGGWIIDGRRVIADSNCSRIEHLVQSDLREIARRATGWDVLYMDSADGRYWELVYPESHLHGGGPPTLRHLTAGEAQTKYKVPWP